MQFPSILSATHQRVRDDRRTRAVVTHPVTQKAVSVVTLPGQTVSNRLNRSSLNEPDWSMAVSRKELRRSLFPEMYPIAVAQINDDPDLITDYTWNMASKLQARKSSGANLTTEERKIEFEKLLDKVGARDGARLAKRTKIWHADNLAKTKAHNLYCDAGSRKNDIAHEKIETLTGKASIKVTEPKPDSVSKAVNAGVLLSVGELLRRVGIRLFRANQLATMDTLRLTHRISQLTSKSLEPGGLGRKESREYQRLLQYGQKLGIDLDPDKADVIQLS